MSKYLESFLASVQTHMAGHVTPENLNKDLVLLTKQIAASTEAFLIDNNLSAATEGMNDMAMVANENYQASQLSSALSIDAIEAFVISCGIPTEFRQVAIETVGIILHKHMGQRVAATWRTQGAKSTADNNIQVQDLNTIFTNSVVSELASWSAPSAESFGVNIDSALPDMKMAITVAMMRFHTSLTSRIMPTRPTPSPTIQYIKENIDIMDLSDTTAVPKKVVELYADPTLVTNQLKTIAPLAANNPSPAVLVSNGIIKFAVNANLLELSIDSSKPGYTKVNSTDTIADGARLDSVYVTLNDDTSTETFKIELPVSSCRFTRPSNARDAAIRTVDVQHTALLLVSTKTSAGATSTLLSTLEAGEGLAVSLNVKASLNLKTGVVNSLCSLGVTTHHMTAGESVSAAATTLLGLVNATTVPVATGYSVVAKHSEENLRKSNIQIRAQRQPFAYDIPTGRNYVYDYAIGQRNPESNAAMLTKIISIGQDSNTLNIITETLDSVYNENQAAGTNPLDADIDAGTSYVAGAKVRPYVYQGTIAMGSITSIKDSDRSGDIKQRMLTILNAVAVELCEKSFIAQQLPAGAKPTFKCVTTGGVLGNLLGVPHTHNHLNDTGAALGDGVEYRLVLPSGIILEVATTTFTSMENKIILIPYVQNSPESVLNFAHNWDYGTLIGNFTSSGDGNFNRLFANSRELPIPVCPVGCVLDITGIDTAVFIAV